MIEQAIGALIASGPLAVILGAVAWTLWKKLQALRVFYEGDPEDEKRPGKIAQMVTAAQVREDNLRISYDKRLADERAEQKTIMGELNKTLRGEFVEE